MNTEPLKALVEKWRGMADRAQNGMLMDDTGYEETIAYCEATYFCADELEAALQQQAAQESSLQVVSAEYSPSNVSAAQGERE